MTRREFYVQCTKYQFLKCVRETAQEDLNRSQTYSLCKFAYNFKSKIMAEYDPTCVLKNAYNCIYVFLINCFRCHCH